MSWEDAYNAAMATVGKHGSTKTPSRRWKQRMLLAEHSPIRMVWFGNLFIGIKYWIVMHLVRHKIGVEHFVRTQRDDRLSSEMLRDDIPQGATVDYLMHANAQAIINISRKRLCRDAHQETREWWKSMVSCIGDPEVQAACVPECIYRGFCPSLSPCGYYDTEKFKQALEAYRAPSRSMQKLRNRAKNA